MRPVQLEVFWLSKSGKSLPPCNFLFNQASYEDPSGPGSLVFAGYGGDRYLGRVLVQGREGKYLSGLGRPFGGLDLAPGVDVEYIRPFFQKVLDELKQREGSSFEVTLFPKLYDPTGFDAHVDSLMDLGFEEVGHQESFYLDLSENLEENLHDSHRRRLRKSKTAGFEVKKVGFEAWKDLYPVLRKIRNETGIPLRIDSDTMMESLNRNPEAYDLYKVMSGNQIVGASFGVSVSREVYYKFIPTLDPAFNIFSPMVQLTMEMGIQAREKGHLFFDLGIAGEMGKARNKGLETFKARLGGVPSPKKAFRRDLKKD